MLKAPDPVRSPQLSNIWTSQYYGGGPHGNTGCCSFCNFFCSNFCFVQTFFFFFIKDIFFYMTRGYSYHGAFEIA